MWLMHALAKRYRRFLVTGFFLGVVAFALIIFLYPILRPVISGPNVKRIGIIGSYTPSNFPIKIQSSISFGLTQLTPNGEATGAAAASWEVDEDGKRYVFHLAENLIWQDGEKLKAADINYNFKDTGVKITNDQTIEFNLKEPFAPFPTLVSQPLFKKGLVGLGRYRATFLKVSKVNGDDNLQTLALTPTTKSANLPILEYKFYPTEKSALTAFKLGEVDNLEGITDISVFDNWPVKIEKETLFNRLVAVFYHTENGFLAEKNIRQALTYALPDFSQGYSASSSINTNSWAYNDDVKKYEYDPKMAQELFKKTGIATKSGERKLTLTTMAVYEPEAREISKAWQDLGIETNIEIADQLPANFEVLLATQEIPADPDQYSLWHSTQEKTNITHYKNPRIDKLLEDGRTTVDKKERKRIYFDFQKYLIDDAPAAFLYHPVVYNISRR